MVGTSTPVESIPVLDFDDTTAEFALFTGVLFGYGGSGITVSVG